MKRKLFYLVFFSLLTMTTVHSVHSETKAKLDLNAIDHLRFGNATRDEIRSQFGAPDLDRPLPSDTSRVIWIYFQEGIRATRASLIFNAQSGTLESADWFIAPSEKENSLKVAKARYPDAKFVHKHSSWKVADIFEEREYFEDRNLGVTLYFESGQKYVHSIARQKPTSSPALANTQNTN